MVAKSTLQFALISIAAVAVAAGAPKRVVKVAALSSAATTPGTTASVTTTTTAALSSFTPTVGATYPANWDWKLDYPALYGPDYQCCLVPATNSTLAKEWIALVNMTAIPSAPLNKEVNGSLVNSYGAGNNPYCDWSFDQKCLRDGDVPYCPTKGVFGITVNDGPTTFGSDLYDWLSLNDLKATLFWIGSNIAQNPQIAQKGCIGGNHIGFQSWSYTDLSTLTNEQIIVELKWTETIIHELCNITPRYFRPPVGDVDNRVRAIAAQLGYIPILWDLDTKDWEYGEVTGYTTDQENGNFTAWISEEPADTHGHIILLHELTSQSISEITVNIPKLQNAYKAMSVASCLGDAYPYKEKTSAFCPIWVNNALIPCASNTTSSVTTTSPNATTVTVTTTAAPSSASSVMKRGYFAETVSAIVVIVAIAMIL